MEDIKKFGAFMKDIGEYGGLIKQLQDAQAKFGYVSKSEVKRISQEFNIAESEIYGVITFYSQFRLKPLGKHTIKICRGTACHVSGSLELVKEVRELLGLLDGEDTTKDLRFTLEEVACLGCCSLAPAVMINKDVFGKVNREKLSKILESYK
jgi:NADH-quinone oxidoreductase subunit E